MAKYVVAPGRSVLLPKQVLLKPGSPVPDDVPKKLIAEWENSGFIKPVGGQVVPKDATLLKEDGSVAENKRIVQPGKFNHDPDKLDGRSLEDLNLMLIDLGGEPADTKEEAIGLLSSDYKD